MHGRMFSTNPPLYPLDTSSTLPSVVTSKNVPKLCHMSPGGQNLPLVENHCYSVTATMRVWASQVPDRCFLHAELWLLGCLQSHERYGTREMKGIVQHQHGLSGVEEITITLEQLMIEAIYFKPFNNLLSNVHC